MDGVLKIGIQNEEIAAYSLIIVLMAAICSGGYMFLNQPSYALNENTIANLSINNNTKEHSDALFSYAKSEMTKSSVSLSQILTLKYKSAKVHHVAEGIEHIQFKKLINSKPVKVNVLEINRSVNPDIRLAPSLAGSTPHSKATIKQIAAKTNAVAAINGTYFKPNTGTPLGMLVIDNKVISGPVYNRVALGLRENDFVMSRTDITGKIITRYGNIRINNVNQPRMLTSDVLLYTPEWGRIAPAVKSGHTAIKVVNNVVVEISKLNPLTIASNTVIIDAPQATVADIQLGDEIAYDFSVNEKLKGSEHVISGGDLLVRQLPQGFDPEDAEALLREAEVTGALLRDTGRRIRTVYIGGGTPTTLSGPQLERLMTGISRSFDLSHAIEYTVEAGRPDTLEVEKLRLLRDLGADRTSINPQTMNDAVLRRVGRCHTAADTERAFFQAREAGFDRINMDLIAGLPEEDLDSFRASLDRVLALDPSNVTVHTLALKKGADLFTQRAELTPQETVAAMVAHADRTLTARGYAPYYLYRQKYMTGSFENVGWCRDGDLCLYNIYMMEELHSIVSLGAGGMSKANLPNGRLTRFHNPKYPEAYLKGFDRVLEQKREFIDLL